MRLFHVATITNDAAKYAAMKDSFLAAGFDPSRARYSVFDNTLSNKHEPFSTFNRVVADTVEPYIIFCHQDILLDQGHGFEQLVRALRELEESDPNWAVAGNAGVTEELKTVFNLTDPYGRFTATELPKEVCALDENFLVVRRASGLSCSKNLQGFHFYGPDLCLNAITHGLRCYVIGFHLSHLGRGTWDDSYRAAERKFQEAWNRAFAFRYFRTTSGFFFLSRYWMLRKIFGIRIVGRLVWHWPNEYNLLKRAFERVLGKEPMPERNRAQQRLTMEAAAMPA